MDSKTPAMDRPVREAGLDYGQFEQAANAWTWLREHAPAPARLRVVGDDDSDGVNSAYVLATALRRAGYEVETRVMPVHSEADADQALQGRADAVLIADSGSNLIAHLDSHPVPVLVLDHHRVHGHAADHVYEMNPRRAGGDRVWHVSASIVSLLFALAIDARNWDLSFSALAGAVSDRQHLGGLEGLVGYAVEGGVRAGVLTRSEGFTLVGGTVAEAVTDSLDPYFDGLTGNAPATRTYLAGLPVDAGADPIGLPAAPARKIADDLTRRLQAKHVVTDRMYPLFGQRPLLRHPSGVPSVFALAALIEAATAEHEHEAALRLLSGAVDAHRELRTVARHRWQRILTELDRLRGRVQEKENVRWAEARDDANTGVYAHTLLTYVHGDDKPFLVASRRGDLAKFSARGSPRLYLAGVDLSLGMATAAEALGGHGGGHPGAAGASVPWDRRDEFVDGLDRALGQLRGRTRA